MSGNGIYIFDVQAAGLLPANWLDQIAALAAGPGRQRLIELASGDAAWTFDVVLADIVTVELGWLSALYSDSLRRFASQAFGLALVPANRRSAAVTLNLLAGVGATNAWHSDSNPVTGVFYASTLGPADGGQLEFRDGRSFSPVAGQFVCFAGGLEHRTAPLLRDVRRLASSMTYYTSVADQPFANVGDIYTPPEG